MNGNLATSQDRRAVILLYHRVIQLPTDPQLLCVSPSHFAEQMQYLRSHLHPLSLGDLREAMRAGDVPRGAVAVTFDDGYADNFTNALPVLRRFRVPATVCVTTHGIEQRREFWWDEVEQLLLWPNRLPETLSLQVGSQRLEWHLAGDAKYEDGEFDRRCSWNVLDETTCGGRQQAYLKLCGLLRPLRPDERARVLDELFAQCGLRRMSRLSHRAMTADELRLLAADGLVEIGSHTVSHPVLSALSVPAQRAEIEDSKRQLEDILMRPVSSFSYPYGTRRDYSETTIGLVRQAGYHCACANSAGCVESTSDVYQLPRMIVRDWDADTLAAKLMTVWPDADARYMGVTA